MKKIIKRFLRPKSITVNDKEMPLTSFHSDHKKDAEKIEFTISIQTVLKILTITVLFWWATQIIMQLQTILIIAAISFFMALMLSPMVSFIERFRIPRPIAILFLYTGFFGVFGILFVQIVPVIAEQLLSLARDLRVALNPEATNSLVENLPSFLQPLVQQNEFDLRELQIFLTDNLSDIAQNLQGVAGSTLSVMSQIFQGFFNFFFSLVLIFFILLEREQIAHFFLSLFPKDEQGYLKEKVGIMQKKMGDWVRGQLILMVYVGLTMYVGLKVLEYFFGMKYAVTISLLAACMELFPYIGLLITGAVSVMVAANVSYVLVISVLVWMAVVQFLEGNIMVPIVMEKATGLSSVAVIIALSIGGILGNIIGGIAMAILGIILSVPIAASVSIFITEYAKRNE